MQKRPGRDHRLGRTFVFSASKAASASPKSATATASTETTATTAASTIASKSAATTSESTHYFLRLSSNKLKRICVCVFF
jgi:hypothetical protein